MKNIYKPMEVTVAKVEQHSSDVKLFRLKPLDTTGNGSLFPVNTASGKQQLVFMPGQFMIAGVWGFGEAPFGAASSPYERRHIDLLIRSTGQVTKKLHTLKKGDTLTLRGPYGNGYPTEFFSTMADLLLVTGGCGLPPIASLVRYILKNRKTFGRVHLVYGARTPDDILLKTELEKWRKTIDVTLTVDKATRSWKGRRGFVSQCLEAIKIDPRNTAVAMCGPGPMVYSIESLVNPMGIPDRRIFISAERRMQCGVGRCQHCACGSKLVCMDGPVFNLDEYDMNWD